MDSFVLHAVGHLARDPEPLVGGQTPYTRLCLIGNDYTGIDDEGKKHETTTFLWFTAFSGIAETITKHARQGDQLIVQARIRSSPWTDGDGKPHYDHSFILTGFRFGAPGRLTRQKFAETNTEPSPTTTQSATTDMQ